MEANSIGSIDDYINELEPCAESIKSDLLPKVCELHLVLPLLEDAPYPLLCNLEFGRTKEVISGHDYDVSLNGADLVLEVDGYNVHKAGKFGSVRDSVSPKLKSNVKIGTETEGKLTIPFLASILGKRIRNVECSIEENHYFVVANSSLTWQISDLPNSTTGLSGRTIPGEQLCLLTPSRYGNLKSVKGRISVVPEHINLIPVSPKHKKLKHLKLVKALIAKRMRNTNEAYPQIDSNGSYFTISFVNIGDDVD